VIYAAALLPVSLLPAFVGISGLVYLASALVLGMALLVLSVRFARTRTEPSARALFFGSITYLPVLWIVMIANRL
jgi:protoheme IX farnesyltransferase